MNTAPQETTELSDQQKLDPPAAPPANDDLTIAEQIRNWKQSSGEGEDAYLVEGGDVIRVPEHTARQFVEDHGALHPGDYRSKYERDWREDFAALEGAHDK